MITKQKKTEFEIQRKNEELQHHVAVKDKFFSIIAHDLRGPLGTFMNLSQILEVQWTRFSDTRKTELLTSLSAAARNSYRLLENLLKWSQIQRGNIDFNPEKIHLTALANQSMEIASESARLKGIELRSDISPEYFVYTDSNMLQTIIRNLISNAIKFTGEGGCVTLSARPASDNGVVISVKDTGIGMTPAILDGLFRIDVKTKRSGTANEEGTGLGLLLCKELIEKNGGNIAVESEAGKGTMICFNLPSVHDHVSS